MNDQTPRASQPAHIGESAPYQGVSAEQRAICRAKGQRYIGFGIAWLAAGIIISVVTYAQAAQAGGVYVIAYGPALYGVYRIIRGVLLLGKSQ
jgi:hypothetical protein